MFQPKRILSSLGIKEKQNILDLGCGPQGFFTIPSSHLTGVKGKVFAVDVRKQSLDFLMHQAKYMALPNILPVHTNIEISSSLRPYILDEQIDHALCINTLGELKNKRAIFPELYRSLKPDAKLLIVDWKIIPLPFGPAHEMKIDQNTLIAYGKESGFEVLKTFDISAYHYGALFTRL